MGKTLFGIDLDESPAGGLVRRLLDEEELAKLDARPDGGVERDEEREGGPEPGDGRDGEAETEAGSDETDGSTGRPLGDADRAGTTVGSTETAESDEEESGLLGSRLRTVLLAVAGLAVLVAVLALVARRYGDRLASAVPVPDRLRRGDPDDGSTDEEEPTRPGTDRGTGSSDTDRSDAGVSDRRWNVDGDGTGGGDDDLGALVGLAFLALVAALARKVAERPADDPLLGDESSG